MKSLSSFASFLTCVLVSAAACSSDDDSETPEVVEPATLAIAELRPNGADAWRAGDPEPLTLGCDALLGVALEIENFTLRPRGACGSVAPCGYVHATLNASSGSVSADTALHTFVLDLANVELSPEDPVTLRVELRTGDGEAFEQPAGEVLSTELTVALERRSNCELGSGGAGGQSGSAGASGAGGSDSPAGGAAGEAGAGPSNAAGAGGAPAAGAGGAPAAGAGGEAGAMTTSSGAAGEAGAKAASGGEGGEPQAGGAAGEAGAP